MTYTTSYNLLVTDLHKKDAEITLRWTGFMLIYLSRSLYSSFQDKKKRYIISNRSMIQFFYCNLDIDVHFRMETSTEIDQKT